MRVLIILITSLFFTIIALGQQPTQDSGFIDKAEAKNELKNGVKEGKWIEYSFYDFNISDNSSVPCNNSYRLTVYKSGVPFGIQRVYKCNGELWVEIIYIGGIDNRIEKIYYSNGTLKSLSPYTFNKLNGVRRAYYENGKLLSETIFTNGIQGIIKSYYENGNEIK